MRFLCRCTANAVTELLCRLNEILSDLNFLCVSPGLLWELTLTTRPCLQAHFK